MSFRPPALLRISRFWLLAVCVQGMALGMTPAQEFQRALKHFRTDGPPGWAYVQVSSGEGKDEIEAYDPLKFPPLCWTLLEKDHKKPTAQDQLDYRNLKAQRSSEFNAPRIETELDLATCRVLEDTPDRLRAEFRLRENADTAQAAQHLKVEVTLDRPTQTIVQIDIRNIEPFSILYIVRIDRMHTEFQYSLPKGGRPSLLMRASISEQGKILWLKTLDQHLEIVRKGYRYAGKTPAERL